MRVAVDLQPMQSAGSRNRGIGRYVQSVLECLFPLAREVRYDLYSNGRLPAPEFAAPTASPQAIGYEAPGITGTTYLNEVLLKTVLLRDRPDALFLPSSMEGSDSVVPSFADFPLPLYAISYDLVPLIFPNKYLTDRNLRTVYYKRLQNLRHADFLFAISESARQDTIRLLDVSPEKIINVSAGVSPFFVPTPPSQHAPWHSVLAEKFGITRPFVMCTGGEDWRKNLEGLVDGFARLPAGLQKEHQLVIACRMSSEGSRRLKQRAYERGLSASDLVITGFVSDEELRAMYGLCKLFAFPSLYEGFGLPLVEALACGAPVVTGNNSSLVEIVPSPDQLFDARSVKSITHRLESLLSHPAQLESLREKAPQEAAPFTWQAVAQKISAAFERDAARGTACAGPAPLRGWDAAPERQNREADPPSLLPAAAVVRETFVFRRAVESENETITLFDEAETGGASWNDTVPAPSPAKPRVAFWSPFRPLQSGVSDYSEEILPALVHHFSLDLFVDDNYEPMVETGTRHRILRHSHFAEIAEDHRRDYYAAIYQMGNSSFHVYQYAALLRYAGISVLHDYNMSGMVNYMATHHAELGVRLFDELSHQYGEEKTRQILADMESGKYDVDGLPAQNIYTNRRVFSRSLGVVLHNPWAYQKAVEEHGAVCPHIALIPPVMPPVPLNDTPNDVLRLREKWGVPPEAFVFASCGIVAETKRPLQTLDAFKTHLAIHPDAFLLFVGSVSLPPELDFDKEIKKRGLQNRVKITGYVGIPQFNECLRLSDVCVTLRYPSNGESSGALLRMLVHGKPSIVTAIGSFDDFPSDTVHKLAPPTKGEAAEVADILGAFEKLQTDAAYRRALGSAGADFIHREHSPERCARLYADFVQTVMHDPLTRSKLLGDYVGREVARAAVMDDLSREDHYRLLAPFEAALAAPPAFDGGPSAKRGAG